MCLFPERLTEKVHCVWIPLNVTLVIFFPKTKLTLNLTELVANCRNQFEKTKEYCAEINNNLARCSEISKCNRKFTICESIPIKQKLNKLTEQLSDRRLQLISHQELLRDFEKDNNNTPSI